MLKIQNAVYMLLVMQMDRNMTKMTILQDECDTIAARDKVRKTSDITCNCKHKIKMQKSLQHLH